MGGSTPYIDQDNEAQRDKEVCMTSHSLAWPSRDSTQLLLAPECLVLGRQAVPLLPTVVRSHRPLLAKPILHPRATALQT